MNIKILLILNIVFSSFVYAETVYKTVDAEGNIIFSDEDIEGAEKIELEEPQTISIPEIKSGYRSTTKLVPKEIEYTQLEIISPKNDTTIRSNEGKINIKVKIMPVLEKDNFIVFLLDGREVSTGKSYEYLLSDLDRGTHTVSVLVKNEKDAILKRSEQLVIHLRKESKLFKNRTKENPAATKNTAVVTESSDNNGSESSISQDPSL